jgi:hypothetical protein
VNVSDFVNGLFEFTGALMTLLSVKALLRDKEIKGIHWGPIVFFTSWSSFNLWFYPFNKLWWSFFGGATIFIVNSIWLYLVWYYSGIKNRTRRSVDFSAQRS